MNITEIWNQYHTDVRQFILSKVKNSDLAEDILQETFIKIHTKLYTLNDDSKLKSWILSIARNGVMDYFRQNNLASEYNVEDLDSKHIDYSINLNHTIEDCLREIMMQLPKKYREPIFMHDIKGIKQTEISKILNLPISTIKSQIQRGRKLIVKGFVNCCDFEINNKGQLYGEIKDKEDCKICSPN